ncbi:MAG: hypothetical protein GX612_01630 [Bacteroidales bacterium]|nr:hypothetical protein [Bacteroidales bacterium]
MLNRKIMRNFGFAFFSNAISMVLSIVMVIVLPVLFGDAIAEYGYVQLYFLYVGYYYVFDLGWCSGIYLREGGKEYTQLNSGSYSAQFILLAISQIIIAVCIIGYAVYFVNDINKQFIFVVVAFNIIIMQLKTMITSLFQATNRIKEYSVTVVIGKLLNALAVIIAIALGIKQYKIIVLSLFFGEFIALLYACFECKEVIFSKPKLFFQVKKEIMEDISAGQNILFSGLSAMLMTGITRICIENVWNIREFAKVSLSINISNIFMVFITAVSVVLYPELRRMCSEKYIEIYSKMRNILMTLLLGLLISYYPLRLILQMILPQYNESLLYMAILLPVCIYSSKMSMLIQTYMKVLRLEKKMMIANISGLLSTCILVVVTVFWLKSITLAIFSILACQIIRTVSGELLLAQYIAIKPHKDIMIELILTILFIIANWQIGGWGGMLIYASGYSFYLFFVIGKYCNTQQKM